ncbi:MAG: type II secretion system protein GspL [Woeseiaceae bacterium]
MEDTVFIYLGEPEQTTATWFRMDAHGSARRSLQSGLLKDAAGLTAGKLVIAIVDYPLVTRTTSDLPVRGKKLMAALPYALEEQFAGDVDELHFAAGTANEDGVMTVAALDRDVMTAYTERLAAAGIVANEMYSLHDSLPKVANHTQLLIDSACTILREEHGAVSALADMPPNILLDAWHAGMDTDDIQAAATNHLRIFVTRDGQEAHQDAVRSIRDQFPDADIKMLDDSVAVFAAGTIAAQGGVNLLQGDFAQRGDGFAFLRPWAPVAALLALAFFVSVFAQFSEMRQLQQRAAELDREIESLLATQGTRGLDPQAGEATLGGMVRKNGGSTSTGTSSSSDAPAYLPTLLTLADALKDDKDTQIDALSYRNGIFDVRLLTKDTDSLETLRKNIGKNASLQAQIQRTEQQDGQVRSFLQIKAASL